MTFVHQDTTARKDRHTPWDALKEAIKPKRASPRVMIAPLATTALPIRPNSICFFVQLEATVLSIPRAAMNFSARRGHLMPYPGKNRHRTVNYALEGSIVRRVAWINLLVIAQGGGTASMVLVLKGQLGVS